MSKRKSGLNIHGILLLDKRLGISSNKALQEVRRLFNANKAGHTGSLDPMATGLLPLCFGEATKVSSLMLDDNKRYQVVIQLGVVTDTGDAEGNVIATKPVPELTPIDLQLCLDRFTGDIEQVPPMYSALKQNGKKLYQLAREGKTVERKARHISIFELKLLDFFKDQITLEVLCSKGTYIRSLAEDIGYFLGCGGSVRSLRRLESGQFSLKNAYKIEQLTAMEPLALTQCLINVDKPLETLPFVQLSDQQTISIKLGQSVDLMFSEIDSPTVIFKNQNTTVRMYNHSQFLGLGEMRLDGKLAPKKLFNLTTNFITR